MNALTFGQPLWLWALLLLPICVGLYLLNSRRRRELLRKVVAPRLREQLVANVSHVKRRLRFGLFLLALAFLIVALAQPRYGSTFEEATRKGRDILIAIDTSRSMLANDLQPNRLTRAKLAAQDLINQLGGDRVGLIAFAGTSFLQAPLTADYSAVLNALNELDTQIIPRGGTNLASAIHTAVDAFGKGESTSRGLIIFTDGEELDQNALAAAAKVAGEIKIFTVGVGSEDGSVIPVTNERGGTDFVRDGSGEIVKSKLDPGLLSRLAEASGGFYLRLQNGPADMARIVSEGLSGLTEQDIDERTARRPIERYQWPLAAGIVLMTFALFITDRKRVRRPALAALLMGAAGVLAPSNARALDAVESYQAGNYEQAYEDFQRHKKLNPDSARLDYGSGTAAYKLGRFDEALAAFSKALAADDPALRAKSEYNIGNTLFRRGQQHEKGEAKIAEWKEALNHYEETLKLEPENEDAIHNRDLVKKLIEQEQQKQEQEQEKQQDEEKKDDQEQKQDQQDEGEQDKPQDQDKGDEPSDQQSQPQDGEGKGDEEKSEDGQPKPDDQPGQGEEGSDQSQDQEGQNGEEPQDQPGQPKPGEPSADSTPEAAPAQPDRDRSGELETQPGEEQTGEKGEEALAAEAAEEDGKMSERQAAALLRSLQGDEASVPLNQPPVSGRVTKDW